MASANVMKSEFEVIADNKRESEHMLEIEKIITDCVEFQLNNQQDGQMVLNDEQAKEKSGEIVDMILNELAEDSSAIKDKKVKKSKNWKYIVSCIVAPKNGAALHSASSVCWDNQTDESTIVRWENRLYMCVVSLFALRI